MEDLMFDLGNPFGVQDENTPKEEFELPPMNRPLGSWVSSCYTCGLVPPSGYKTTDLKDWFQVKTFTKNIGSEKQPDFGEYNLAICLRCSHTLGKIII